MFSKFLAGGKNETAESGWGNTIVPLEEYIPLGCCKFEFVKVMQCFLRAAPNPAYLWLVYCPTHINPRNHPNTQTLVRIDLAQVFIRFLMTELEEGQPLSSNNPNNLVTFSSSFLS